MCLLTDKPDHPMLAATASLLLRARHEVTYADPDSAGVADGAALADVYLLKAHTSSALALARTLEARGARVVNSAAATELCQDRSRIADVAAGAGIPMPRTRTLPALSALPPDAERYPLMVKSRHSRRGDLVVRVDGPERLRELAAAWPEEPVVVQEFTPNSGWDHKLWVIAGQVFTGLRPAPGTVGTTSPLPAPVTGEPPSAWTRLALYAGEVFGLDVYGIDVLDRTGEPVVVDVNAFPGIRGPEGAPRALAALICG
ncbi:RimK family alpha-L-glutamate ligase [Streptomyces sp. NPDC005794]|uniref:ATP-grasp domain-containing protein n=1 Tax=Streptomyces sp. NPDC005794 TaxID=3364733 RepID=UPI0036BD0738